MAKTNNQGNNTKPRPRISMFHVLLVLIGADLILLLAPEFGILNSILYIPDIYTWPALAGGIALLVLGFRKLYK
ncbi:MAG: hypothetical protein HGA70_08125 [Chlorobiaceae bacterium]|nr:hypothetical protein [Chlorobiaceae bacterium]NTW10955.1 hypothetical protein [Chlorobiaceae bacterium]